jgi:hypothetical protein
MFSPSYQLQARAEIERRRRVKEAPARNEHFDNWQEWLSHLFPAYVSKPFAQRHTDLWEWVERLQPGIKQPAFVAIWPRGGAKSTSAELACVRVGAKRSRFYVWYISRTQDKADKHVETIASLLESTAIEREHPDIASRKVGKYGNSKGWRRSRLRTASGLTIDALGLDVGARGAKVEEQRPDLMIFDDVDEKHDTSATTQKIIETITTSLLPAGSSDCAVLFIQNKIHPNSIAAQLAEGKADFLTDREVSGPHPAVEGLTYEQRGGKFEITGGEATWEGQDIDTCQAQINTWGLSAFLQEAQHEVEQHGGIWDHIEFRHCRFDQVPTLERVVVWVDPAVTSTDQSDNNGLIVDGLGVDGNLYRLFAWEGIDSPESVLSRALDKAVEYGASTLGVETDQGGDTWYSVVERVREKRLRELTEQLETADGTSKKIIEKRMERVGQIMFNQNKAGAGYGSKVERNARMLVDYEHGKVIHVEGTHGPLERSLRRFPMKPLDLADASFWGWNDLMGDGGSLILFST